MKDIKTFVIGFLTCCCMFLIMGQTENNVMKDIKTFITENGRYQGFKGADSKWEYLIDTRNGAMWYSEGEVWVQQIKEVFSE